MSYKRANGTGTVYKLSGRRRKPWAVVVTNYWTVDSTTEKPQQHRVYIGFYATRSEALVALSDYVKTHYSVDHINMTLAELWEYWRANGCRNYSQQTITTMSTGFRAVSQLHDRIYRTITPADVEMVISSKSPDNQERVKRVFVSLDAMAQKLDIPIKQIHSIITVAKKPKRAERSVFTEEEIDKLWTASEDRAAQILLIYLYSGWRLHELLLMPKTAVDLENWTMIGGEKTDAGKDRIVPIHPRIRPFIQAFMETKASYPYLIPSQTLKSRLNGDKFRMDAQCLMADLGIQKHTIHECRHTFRTRLYNAHVDTIIIDRLCGHVSNGSTGESVYTHIKVEQLRAAIELLR